VNDFYSTELGHPNLGQFSLSLVKILRGQNNISYIRLDDHNTTKRVPQANRLKI